MTTATPSEHNDTKFAYVTIPVGHPEDVWIDLEKRNGKVVRSALKTADVLRALNATANADKELESARKAARDESDRADKAEANYREVKRELGYAEMGADQWRNRAEAAEAKLERVREFREWLSRPTAYATKAAVIRHLDDALADPTPFELPTEAGARFEARHGGNDTTDEFLTVNCDGKPLYLRLASSCIYGPESVLGCFGHFRLIEADE
jgi:soluble cytochrome b562